jgi:hypothetical protein
LTWNGAGKASQDARSATNGHTLIAHLRGCCNSDIIDSLGGQVRISPKKLMEGAYDEIVCPRLGVDALLACTAERSSDRID